MVEPQSVMQDAFTIYSLSQVSPSSGMAMLSDILLHAIATLQVHRRCTEALHFHQIICAVLHIMHQLLKACITSMRVKPS